jgi:parvulin-like peptidyl-prolyl isomerase
MRSLARIFLCLGCVTLLAAGCGGGDKPETEQAGVKKTTPSTTESRADQRRRGAESERTGDPLSPKDVVAVINGTTITVAELDDFMGATLAALQRKYKDEIPTDMLMRQRKTYLDRMINERLQIEEAKRRNINVDPAEVNARVEAMLDRYNDPAQFYTSLERQGMTIEQYKERLQRQAVIRQLTEKVQGTALAEDDPAVREYYEQNKERFSRPEMVRVSQILVRIAPDASNEEVAAANKKAEEVSLRAKQGEDFAVLAKEYSDDPASAARGGDMRYLTRGRMPEEFEAVAFALKDGEISSPVRTNMGFHVIKTTERREAGVQPFEEVKPMILRQLRNEQVRNWLDDLRTKADVQINM